MTKIKKTTRLIFLLLAISVAIPTISVAQEKKKSKFGSFMRKMGESTTGINMTDEPFITNPVSDQLDLQIIGCYGDSASRQVQLVLMVTSKKSTFEAAVIGGGTEAYDTKGNVFKEYSSSGDDALLPLGIPVRYTIKRIEKVPPTLKAFELIRAKYYLNAGNHSGGQKKMIELHNIPIQWNKDPDSESMSTEPTGKKVLISSPVKSCADIELAGCYGDSKTGSVQLVLLVKSKANYKEATFGGNLQAYDTNGNLYKQNGSVADAVSLPAGIPVKYSVEGIRTVPASVKEFAIIRMKWYLDANNHSGNTQTKLELRNVPIQWDLQPE